MGVGLAAVIAAIFRTVSADWSARRIQAANWRDLAALAASPRTQAPRLRGAHAGPHRPAATASGAGQAPRRRDGRRRTQDLRVGRDITELQRARRPAHGRTGATPRARRTGALLPRSLVLARRPENAGIPGADRPRWLAGVARPPAGRATARWWRWWASAAPSSPTRVPTRPSPPGGPRIMIGEFNLYGTSLAAGAGRGHAGRGLGPAPAAGRRPVPAGGTRRCSTWRCSWCCYGVTLISPIFSRDSHEDQRLRPAAIGKFALTAAVVAAAVAPAGSSGCITKSNPGPATAASRPMWCRSRRMSGLVTDVPVHDNQDVKAGDVLFEIDRARFQLAYDQAQASVRSAGAREQRCATPSATARWASWSRRKPWNRARPSCSRPRPRWPRPRCS